MMRGRGRAGGTRSHLLETDQSHSSQHTRLTNYMRKKSDKHNLGLQQRSRLPSASKSSGMIPLVSPPRLRRLGVRQSGAAAAELDQSSTTTESSSVPESEPTHYPDQNKYAEAKGGRSLTWSLNPLGRTLVLKCPVCTKMFLSFHGHDLHLDTHASTAIKCWKCNLRFNSNKSLLQHQRLRHNKRREASETSGCGFHSLVFVDFSCDKFAAISQKYCEQNSVQAACSFHDYACNKCHKSFPMSEALRLHTSQYHYYPSKFICSLCNHDYHSKYELDQHKHKYMSASTRKHLPENKRKFIRALSLMPQCAAQSIARPKAMMPPAINMDYHNRLEQVPRVTQLVYSLSEEVDQEEYDNAGESDSSQS